MMKDGYKMVLLQPVQDLIKFRVLNRGIGNRISTGDMAMYRPISDYIAQNLLKYLYRKAKILIRNDIQNLAINNNKDIENIWERELEQEKKKQKQVNQM